MGGMSKTQYHATSWDRVPSILRKGLQPPRGSQDIATNGHAIPTISTANDPDSARVYHPHGALLEFRVRSGAKYLKRSNRDVRRGESLQEAVDRWLQEAKDKGADGFWVEGWQSTIGNQTIEPKALEFVRVVNADEDPRGVKTSAGPLTVAYLKKLLARAEQGFPEVTSGPGFSVPFLQRWLRNLKDDLSSLNPATQEDLFEALSDRGVFPEELLGLKRVSQPRTAPEKPSTSELDPKVWALANELFPSIILRGPDLTAQENGTLSCWLQATRTMLAKHPVAAKVWHQRVKKVMLDTSGQGSADASWEDPALHLRLRKTTRASVCLTYLLHELGHAFQSAFSSLELWEHYGPHNGPCISAYAETNSDEDFAETFLYYLTAPRLLQRTVPLKYQDMKSRVSGSKRATKTPGEREESEAERLVRPSPKKKPPRKDLRRERMDVEKDPDTARATAENDRDLSLNYKKVARQWLLKVSEREHQPGEVWKMPHGDYHAKNMKGEYGFYGPTPEDQERAKAFAKGTLSKQDIEDDEEEALLEAEEGQPEEGQPEEDQPEEDQPEEGQPEEAPEEVEPTEEPTEEDPAEDEEVEPTADSRHSFDTEEETAEAPKPPTAEEQQKIDLWKSLGAVDHEEDDWGWGQTQDAGSENIPHSEEMEKLLKTIPDESLVKNFKKMKPGKKNVVMDTFYTDLAEWQTKEVTEDTIQDVLDQLSRGGEGLTASEMGSLAAANAFAQSSLTNPKTVVPFTQGPFTPSQLEGVSVASYDRYRLLTPQLRNKAFNQVADQLEASRDGSPEQTQLHRILDGLQLASIMSGDEAPDRRVGASSSGLGGASLLPEPSGQLKSLLLLQDDSDPSDMLKASFYSPEGRQAIRTRMEDLDDEVLVDFFAEGDKELEQMLAKALEKMEAPWQKKLVRSLLTELSLDGMTTMHAMLMSQAASSAPSKTKPSSTKSTPSETKKEEEDGEEKTEPKAKPKTPEELEDTVREYRGKLARKTKPALMAYLSCVSKTGGSSPEEAQKACAESANQLRLDRAAEFLRLVKRDFGIVDETDPFLVQMQSALERKDPGELDRVYRRTAGRKFRPEKTSLGVQWSAYTEGIAGEGLSARRISAPTHKGGQSGADLVRRLSMANMTKKGARSVTQTLDRVASLFQQDWKSLGVPAKIAQDFAYRCDLLSDRVEKMAAQDKTALTELDVFKEPGFDPEEIGEEKGGPLEMDSDESAYMDDHFTQQNNRELRERVEDKDLGMSVIPEPQSPKPGKQAFTRIGQEAVSAQLGAAGKKVQAAAAKIGDQNVTLAASLLRLASLVLDVQRDVLTGKTSALHAAQTLSALDLLDMNVPATKLAKMVSLATKVVESEDDEDDEVEEEEEDDEEEEKEAAKKAAARRLAQVRARKAAKKAEEDEAVEEKEEEKDEDEEASKKASHGFNLFE